MVTDCFGGELSDVSKKALGCFNKAAQSFLRHGPEVVDHLNEALEEDSAFAAALTFEGFTQLLLARRETIEQARLINKKLAKTSIQKTGTALEKALAAALGLACDGQWRASADLLQAYLVENGVHALVVKIAHMLRFMSGDARGMLSLTESIARSEDQSIPGYGFMLGCHAFAQGEARLFAEAEATAQIALLHAPDDIWGMHALAHIYEVCGRSGEGLLWVESGREFWSRCNNFARHMAWHLALFNIERGKYGRALKVYDDDIRPGLSEDFRDAANAVSLLWRLKQMEIDTGNRFEELHALALRRKDDTTLVFANLHHLLSMLALGDMAGANGVLQALEAKAEANQDDQAEVAREIGVPITRSMIKFWSEKKAVSGLTKIAENLPAIGGSAVQQDLFLRTMLLMADDVCDHTSVNGLIGVRTALRQEDAFARMLEERRCFGGVSSQTEPLKVA